MLEDFKLVRRGAVVCGTCHFFVNCDDEPKYLGRLSGVALKLVWSTGRRRRPTPCVEVIAYHSSDNLKPVGSRAVSRLQSLCLPRLSYDRWVWFADLVAAYEQFSKAYSQALW